MILLLRFKNILRNFGKTFFLLAALLLHYCQIMQNFPRPCIVLFTKQQHKNSINHLQFGIRSVRRGGGCEAGPGRPQRPHCSKEDTSLAEATVGHGVGIRRPTLGGRPPLLSRLRPGCGQRHHLPGGGKDVAKAHYRRLTISVV